MIKQLSELLPGGIYKAIATEGEIYNFMSEVSAEGINKYGNFETVSIEVQMSSNLANQKLAEEGISSF